MRNRAFAIFGCFWAADIALVYERWSGKSATVQRYGADGRQIVGFAHCLCLVGRVRRVGLVGHFQALNWQG